MWRKERINAINAHFITAFLDRYVKGDETRAAYLNVPVAESSDGVWPATAAPTAYDAYSPGPAPVTVWKGFQRSGTPRASNCCRSSQQRPIRALRKPP